MPLKSVEETKLVIIDTVEKLVELRDTLNGETEFAVDLEVLLICFPFLSVNIC